jgi:hypothetical protein
MAWHVSVRVKDDKGRTVLNTTTHGRLRPSVHDVMEMATVSLDRIGSHEPLRDGVTVSIVATYKRK